jgi:integrase
MADRKLITDRALKAMAPAPKKGQRVEVWDTKVPGFGVRVSDIEDRDPQRRGKAGRISFMLYTRFAAGAAPTRRVIGIYGAMTLERAREIAGEWRSMIDKGIDPAAVEADKIAAAKREAEQRIKHAFRSVAEDFITDKVANERQGGPVERDLRSYFIEAWGDKPVGEITELDVLAIINRKKRTGKPHMARNLLAIAKRFFNWTIEQRIYGLKSSPCDRLKAAKIIGEKVTRSRRLTDDEIFAFWRATGRMAYPVGDVYRLLLLTGLRLNECAAISWPEITDDILTIPASRMKGREHKAREHIAPLSSSALDLIARLPRQNGGPYIFSYSTGKTPLTMSSAIKEELDARMLRTLRALARQRGQDPEKVELPRWVNHDLRRTVRSGLSALRIPQEVAEAVLAHAPSGLVATYDSHGFLDEKREALEAWAARVGVIVNPDKVGNVVALRSRR